jgi:hypothetical protein
LKGQTLSKADKRVTCLSAAPSGAFLAVGTSSGATLVWGHRITIITITTTTTTIATIIITITTNYQ